MSQVLKIGHATKDYPGGVRALDDVSLTVDAGELLAIVGPSGSGKSTLLNLMGTLDRPTSGTVAIREQDVATLNDPELSALRAREIGFVFQQFQLIEGLTAAPTSRPACSTRACRAEPEGRWPPRRWSRSASATAATTSRINCRAVRSNVSRSPVPWSTTRRWYWPTSRPAPWTPSPAAPSSTCCTPQRGGHHDRTDHARPADRRRDAAQGGDPGRPDRVGHAGGGTRVRVRLGLMDIVGLGLLGPRTRRLRAVLSSLGISIGIATMIVVIGIPASGQYP